jgi:hypothetical protein
MIVKHILFFMGLYPKVGATRKLAIEGNLSEGKSLKTTVDDILSVFDLLPPDHTVYSEENSTIHFEIFGHLIDVRIKNTEGPQLIQVIRAERKPKNQKLKFNTHGRCPLLRKIKCWYRKRGHTIALPH